MASLEMGAKPSSMRIVVVLPAPLGLQYIIIRSLRKPAWQDQRAAYVQPG